jgi:nitronate monooxygenase
MWNATSAAKKVGIEYPIIQGPFGGGLSTTKLASAVSNAGGLGSFGGDSLDGEGIMKLVAEMRSMTAKPFAVNLWIPRETVAAPTVQEFQYNLSLLEAYYRELGIEPPARPERFGQDFGMQIRALLEARPPVFSFVYGVPEASILQECRERSIVTIGTATTPDEAVVLDRAGVDCIVASGVEAGGHKGAFLGPVEESLMGTFTLVPQVVDRVKAPVIAAGGIADIRGVRAALALGAQGVQIGTAFLACKESGASAQYRALLLSAERDDTTLTRVFTGRLARSIRNRLSREMAAHETDLPLWPVQSWFVGSLKAAAIAQGRTDLISLWAGQCAPLVRLNSAEALFHDLVTGLSDFRHNASAHCLRKGVSEIEPHSRQDASAAREPRCEPVLLNLALESNTIGLACDNSGANQEEMHP